jgi:hypothetical protein
MADIAPSFFPVPEDTEIATFVTTLDEDEREFFEERAAIAEYQGELPRSEAEALAYELTLVYRLRKQPAGSAADPSD